MGDKQLTLGQGRELFRQGEKGGDLFFITEGEILLKVHDTDGKGEVVVATLGPKSVIGTMSFLENEPRSATAITKTEIKYVQITQVQRDKLLATVPPWLKVVIRDLSANLRRTNDTLARTSSELEIMTKKINIRDSQKKELEERIEALEKEGSEAREAAATQRKELKAHIHELEAKVGAAPAK